MKYILFKANSWYEGEPWWYLDKAYKSDPNALSSNEVRKQINEKVEDEVNKKKLLKQLEKFARK